MVVADVLVPLWNQVICNNHAWPRQASAGVPQCNATTSQDLRNTGLDANKYYLTTYFIGSAATLYFFKVLYFIWAILHFYILLHFFGGKGLKYVFLYFIERILLVFFRMVIAVQTECYWTARLKNEAILSMYWWDPLACTLALRMEIDLLFHNTFPPSG